MRIPLQISVRNVSLSRAARSNISEKAEKLDQYHDNITSCRVTVEAVNRHQHQGTLYNVGIDITVPGSELVVKRQQHEDVYVAIRDAFNAAQRQVKEQARRIRSEVKAHEEPPVARVARLFPEEEYGFLETPDGREIYFHRNSVLDGRFEQLETGAKVRFAEEMGDEGPQASTVTMVGQGET